MIMATLKQCSITAAFRIADAMEQGYAWLRMDQVEHL
jgi:hypothetical protein